MSLKTKALSEKLAHVATSRPVLIEERGTVREALRLMRAQQVPCLMVCRGGKLAGIFTERDLLMKVLGRAKPEDPIRDYMTANPVIATPEQTLGDAVEIMSAKGLRNLPIVAQSGAPASLVTVSTIIQYLADHFPAAVVNRPPQPHIGAAESDGA